MDLGKRIYEKLSQFEFPEMSRRAEIAVYLVHNSLDPEDYFFLFDFEEFVARSNEGYFVRPALKIFAGRDDFSRVTFAREFRLVFANEFDRMRAELAKSKGKRGWLSARFLGNSALEMVGGVVANLVLATALSVGRSVLGGLSKDKSDEQKLSEEIESTKAKVETALGAIDVTLHPELYDHAYRDGGHGFRSSLDRDVWPLPAYVRAHLADQNSGAWW